VEGKEASTPMRKSAKQREVKPDRGVNGRWLSVGSRMVRGGEEDGEVREEEYLEIFNSRLGSKH
jgi:hypothetical protein